MFRKTLLAGGALLALSLSPAAADYQQGYIAYQQGRYTTAYIEFKESAQQGDAVAQYMLGRLYEEGRGIDRDLVQAYAWYDLAANGGYSDAAGARNRLAGQLSGTQVQTASDLSAQWRGLAGSGSSTPTPAPASAPYSVRAVQAGLNDLGYDAGPEDGLMGPKTRSAIRAYQIDQGLPASGESSVALYEKLQASLASGSGSGTPSADSGGAGTEVISEVQAELRLRGYSIPSITGELDWSTRQAIRKYQQDANLSVTGEIDDTLLAQLRSGREDPAADYRAQVRSVQQALNNLGYDAGPVDGALGPKTRGAIRAFQVAEGLTVDGNVDAELLEELGVAASATPDDDDDDDATTDQGTSEWVRLEIERELVEHNYAAGPVDGVIDTQARAAISAFQRDAGLQANGQASAALLESLRKSSMRNQSYTVSHVVYQIEQDLRTTNYRVGPIDGTLDAETQAGIEAFQRDAGLPVTGRPDQDVMAGLENGPAGNEGNANSLSPQEVWEVEARLRERGYDVGTLDTKASSQTHAAVRAYQKDQGLAVTGDLDDDLLARLQEADATQPKSWDELTGVEKGMTIMQGLMNAVGPALQKQ